MNIGKKRARLVSALCATTALIQALPALAQQEMPTAEPVAARINANREDQRPRAAPEPLPETELD